MKNCVWHSLLLLDKTTCTVYLHSRQDWNPQKASGWWMFLSPDCLTLFFFFFSPPPQTTPRPECSPVMKRQHVETTLTLIWRHDPVLLEVFSISGKCLKTTFSQLCRQSALTSVFWLFLFPFSDSVFVFVPSDVFAAQWTSCSVGTASNIYREHEGGWHAKQPNTMWKASGVLTEYMQCWQAGIWHTVIS